MSTGLSEHLQIPAARLAGIKNKWEAFLASQVTAWVALTCLLLMLPLLLLNHAVITDPDIWCHMRGGEWIVQNHQIPHVDPFSASTMGKPWVSYSWLFDLAAYLTVTRFDLVSIVWYQVLMELAIAATMFVLLRLLVPFWSATGLTAVTILAMQRVAFQPRPGCFSVLFFLIELYLLIHAQRTHEWKLLWALPPLFLLWANIHIEFVDGLFLLGVFCVASLVAPWMHLQDGFSDDSSKIRLSLWTVFAGSILATFVNPYGIGLYRTVFQYAGDSWVNNIVIDLQAIPFRGLGDWLLLGLVMVGCFALGRKRPLQSAWALLMGWSAWMGFRSARELWLVAILSAVVIAMNLGTLHRSDAERLGAPWQRRFAVVATLAAVLVTGGTRWSVTSQTLLNQVAEVFPLGAVKYIHANHLRGPLFNEFTWGGFLMYTLPEIPVAMDGRINLHGEEQIARAYAIWNGRPGWRTQPELEKTNLVIGDRSWALTNLLRSDPRFRVVYEDPVSVLFERLPQETNQNVR